MSVKNTYSSSIEHVEQNNQNDGQEEKEDCETKQTCMVQYNTTQHSLSDTWKIQFTIIFTTFKNPIAWREL